MAERTALLVTGSRDWWDLGPIRARLDLYPRNSILIHGANGGFRRVFGTMRMLGADMLAAGYAGNSLEMIVWPLPYFSDLGKRGGPARNSAMLNVLATLAGSGFTCAVEAFPLGESRGTRGCIAMAQSMAAMAFEKPLVIHVTEGVANG